MFVVLGYLPGTWHAGIPSFVCLSDLPMSYFHNNCKGIYTLFSYRAEHNRRCRIQRVEPVGGTWVLACSTKVHQFPTQSISKISCKHKNCKCTHLQPEKSSIISQNSFNCIANKFPRVLFQNNHVNSKTQFPLHTEQLQDPERGMYEKSNSQPCRSAVLHKSSRVAFYSFLVSQWSKTSFA